VQTPAGKADVSFSANRDRRSATAETVLPDGRRIESRRTTPDGRTWSQIDTVRDADRTVRATLTTTFDGTRYSQIYAPADGEPRTATWNAAQDPSSPIQRVADEGVLPYAAMGAVIGFGAIAGAPLLAAAGVVGLALLALKGDTQDQGKPAPMEARRPQDGEDEDDEGTQGRKKRGHRDGPRPLVEGEVLRPPAQDSDPADSMEPGGDASSGKPPQLTKPYKPPHEQSDEDIDKIAEAIVEHAYGKHKDQGEFSNTEHARELFRHVKKIIKEHGEWKSLPDGRTAYWDKDSGTVVIHNPNAADQGTTHQPKGGRRYYDELE